MLIARLSFSLATFRRDDFLRGQQLRRCWDSIEGRRAS